MDMSYVFAGICTGLGIFINCYTDSKKRTEHVFETTFGEPEYFTEIVGKPSISVMRECNKYFRKDDSSALKGCPLFD